MCKKCENNFNLINNYCLALCDESLEGCLKCRIDDPFICISCVPEKFLNFGICIDRELISLGDLVNDLCLLNDDFCRECSEFDSLVCKNCVEGY